MTFYVYDLIDPRDGSIFYVGKGTRNRIHAHEAEARAGRQSRKCRRIREIEALGLSVVKSKVAHFGDEKLAYAFEAERIEQIGLWRLTNCVPGGGGVRIAVRLSKDREDVEAIAQLLRRTIDITTLNVGLFGDIKFSELRQLWTNKAKEIAVRRSEDWVNSIAASHGVEFRG